MDFYIFLQLLIVSVAATSAMILCNCISSKKIKKLQHEPVFSSFLLTKMKSNWSIGFKTGLVWLIQYIIGFLFVTGYVVLWSNNIMILSFINVLILGVISGIIATASWTLIFKITSTEPPIAFWKYYLYLNMGYIVFAVVAATVYTLSFAISIIATTYLNL